MKILVLVLALGAAATAADLSGVGNFHQINDHLYRGAQPTPEGFRSLAALGVKTVIDLREAGSRAVAEKHTVEGDGMIYINIPFAGLGAPSDEQVGKVLAIFNDPAAGPVFVHWKNQAALIEAKQDGMAWFEKAMQHYVLRYHPPAAVADSATNSSQRAQ